MGCGSSASRGQVVQPGNRPAPVAVQSSNVGHVQPGYHPAPHGMVAPPPHRPGYPPQRPPYPRPPAPQYPQQYGYRQPAPVQYVQQQPNMVVQGNNRSGAGDMMLGMAVGATLANSMHHHHGYGYGHGGGYHDHDTNVNIELVQSNMAAVDAVTDGDCDNQIELGFVEKVENSVSLTSPFFPSKTGGKPAWLALSGLPKSSQISCKRCEKPLVFLLQVYVPADDEKDSAYHRTVFVFCCRDGACYKSNCNKCFTALRCQLPRVNKFYPPEWSLQENDEICQKFEDKRTAVGAAWTRLCEVCGCRGEKLCGRCNEVQYCSKEHQALDWRSGHKLVCKVGGVSTNQTGSKQNVSSLLFPEFDLVTEPEVIDNDAVEDHDRLRKYDEYVKDHGNDESTSDKDWNTLEAESKKINDVVEDKTYWEFKKRISCEPEQVLRYQQHGSPLWLLKLNIPKASDIPKCSCGAERTFEFQILPQLLSHMKVDSFEASIDWGTLAIYTCSNNCVRDDTDYFEEFVWKQDFSNTGLPKDILSKLQK